MIPMHHLCGDYSYFKTDMCKSESSQSHENRVQSADSFTVVILCR